MIIPSREHLAPIINFSGNQFGEWLKNSLQGYYNRFEDRFAFKPMHTFMVQDFSIAADLLTIYQQMQGEEQFMFSQGIVHAITELPFDTENFQSVETLLELAQLVGTVEVMAVLDSKLRKTNLGAEYSWIVRQTYASLEAQANQRLLAKAQT